MPLYLDSLAMFYNQELLRLLRAVADLAISEGIACQVCTERMMACGMGTCQSCVIRIRDAASREGWRYRLCCSDGPVFDAREVVW